MRAKTLLAGTVAAVLTATPLYAQTEVTEDGADSIRQALAGFLEQIEAAGDIQLELDGDVTVVAAGELYEALIPGGDILFEGATFTTGPIDMTLVPLENGEFDTSWMLPERITMEEGGEVGVLTIGNQAGQGVFVPQYQTFLSMDAFLEDIDLVPPVGTEASMSLARLSINGDSQEIGDGRYSGTTMIAAESFDFVGVPGREEFSIGDLSIDLSVTDMDLPAYYAFQTELEALMAETEGQAAQGQPPAAMFDRASQLLANTPPLLDGLRMRYRIGDFVFSDGTQDVDFETGSFGLYLEGLRSDASSFGIELAAGETVLVPEPPEAQFFPDETRIRLAVVDLPNDQLLDVVSQFLASAGQMGPDSAMMMAGLQLQQAVMAGGSTLQVQEVRLANDVAALDLAGEVVPDPAAAFGVVATASMTIAGLPDLIAQLQQTMGQEAQEPIQVLTLLQTMGAPAGEDAGRDVRTYEFEVLPTGQVLLNGADMGPLLQALD